MQPPADYSAAHIRNATSQQQGSARDPKMHDLTAFRFPRTPQAQRVRRSASQGARPVSISESERQRQIASAVNNAYKHYQQQETPPEVLAYVQRVAYIGRLVEQLRQQEIMRKDTSMLGSTLRFLTGSEKGVNMFLPRPTRRQLVQRESEIGGQLFGMVPDNHHRQFFNLDVSTWVWYEEITTSQTAPATTNTTRYEVHENGILKVQDNAPYYFIEGQELVNLTVAVQTYYERISREIYQQDLAIAQPVAA